MVNPIVHEAFQRLYGICLGELDLNDPVTSVEKIIASRFKERPEGAASEYIIVAPGIKEEESHQKSKSLEEWGANFFFIDAEVRCDCSRKVMHSALLRWKPGHRTIDKIDSKEVEGIGAEDIGVAVSLRKKLIEQNEKDAARFFYTPRSIYYKSGAPLISWKHDIQTLYLLVRTDSKSGLRVIHTGADMLTEGLSDFKNHIKSELESMAKSLHGVLGIKPFGKSGHLSAPWDHEHIDSISRLVSEYRKVGERLGVYKPYKWHRRPESTPA